MLTRAKQGLNGPMMETDFTSSRLYAREVYFAFTHKQERNKLVNRDNCLHYHFFFSASKANSQWDGWDLWIFSSADGFLWKIEKKDVCLEKLDLVEVEGTRYNQIWKGLPQWSSSKESACNSGDVSSILGLGRSPGEGKGNPFEYSCLENPMDRGAWWATVHGIAKESDTT